MRDVMTGPGEGASGYCLASLDSGAPGFCLSPGMAHGPLGAISKAQRVSALCDFTPLRQFSQVPNGGAQTYLPRLLERIKT